jgi:undecaprenyl-diphosphatase
MIDLINAFFLGIIQGLTEWLPISSSGHLVIFQQMIGLKVPLLFDVMLHFGTLLAVIVFFWKDIVKIIKSFLLFDFKSEQGKLITYIVIGTLPVAFVGYFFHDFIETLFSDLMTVGISLIVTGLILFPTRNLKGRRRLGLSDSIFIGISQMFALIPGLSRSGITISTGLFRGIDKESVFRFSFLLSIPAILGASLLELLRNPVTEASFEPLFVCIITSAIVGYLSLRFLHTLLKQGKLYYFSFYCFIVGLLVLIL